MLFREKTMFKMYFLYYPNLSLLKSCFEQREQGFFLKGDSYCLILEIRNRGTRILV